MQVRLLGDLAVEGDDGRAIDVNGAKLRVLVAMLSLDVGRVVPAEHLVDALWGEDPPPSVRNSLQALVSKLRRLLGDPRLVAMRGGGYVLQLPPESVDIERFERLVHRATDAVAAGEQRDALGALQDAESLWLGEPLAEFAYEDFAHGPVARLLELHILATELRIDAELALGRHHDVLPELESAVAEHPLREHLRAQLMLALYRAGRQADALRAFQSGRTVLAEELGLDPGPELRRLERSILQQDPALDGPTPAPIEDRSPADPDRARRWEVPAPVTDVVGRDAEVDELVGTVARARVVTLVGPGGVGKTRLALEVARHAGAALANGAVVAELAPVGDATGVRHALAGALRIPDVDGLTDLLADAELLVVIDNCEHLLPATASLAEDLLARCPSIRVLATSREPLRIAGEHVVDVAPLAADAAIALFVERAGAAGGPIAGDDAIEAVAEICRRLDGLPLAIELAAARTRAFPPEHLAARLDDRFRLLTTGSRTALPRQQTLQAVVDWSYDLLFEDQRRFLERVSVFPGGFTIESARTVCADEHVDPDDVEDIVGALVEKSLLRTTWTGDGARFSQLQTLLEYGRQRLTGREDHHEIRRRMRGYFASLCARSPDAYRGRDQAAWIAAVAAEHDNLRTALDDAVVVGDAETALAIAGGVGWYQWLAGLIAEGRRWADDAFSFEGAASDRTRALALIDRAYFDFLDASFRIDRSDPPRRDFDTSMREAVDISRASGDDATLALVLGLWAELALSRGDVDAARDLRTQERAIYLGRDDGWSRAAATYAHAILEVLGDRDPDVAEQRYAAAAELYEACGSAVMVAVCKVALADFVEARGDAAGAVALLDAAVAINRGLQLSGVAAVSMSRLGNALLAAGDLDGAAQVVDEAYELGQRLASAPVVAASMSSRARLSLRLGRLDEAERAAAAALELVRPSRRPDSGRFRPGWAVRADRPAMLNVLGCVALGRGDVDDAVALHRQAVEAAIMTQDPSVMAAVASGLAEALLARGDASTAAGLTAWATRQADASGNDAAGRSADRLAELAGLSVEA